MQNLCTGVYREGYVNSNKKAEPSSYKILEDDRFGDFLKKFENFIF